MANEIELRNALDSHLAVMPLNPTIAWENVPESKWLPADAGYSGSAIYEQTILPATDRSNGVEIGSTDILAGIYQIMIRCKKSEGRMCYQTEIVKLKNHFMRNSSIINGTTRVTFTNISSRAPIPDESYYRVPVSISYVAV